MRCVRCTNLSFQFQFAVNASEMVVWIHVQHDLQVSGGLPLNDPVFADDALDHCSGGVYRVLPSRSLLPRALAPVCRTAV
jgi:hypothetical protein